MYGVHMAGPGARFSTLYSAREDKRRFLLGIEEIKTNQSDCTLLSRVKKGDQAEQPAHKEER